MCAHTSSQVYSCSLDGTVLAWDVCSLQVIRRFQLTGGLSSIRLHGGCLWCCKSSVPRPRQSGNPPLL